MDNTCLTKYEQNKQAHRYFKYADILIKSLLDEQDVMSLYKSKQIVKKIPDSIKEKLILSDINIARFVQLSVVFATIAYQYTNSWTLYYLTSISGINKLKKVLFRNPLYLIIFYTSFFIRPVTGIDSELIKSPTKVKEFFDKLNIPYKKELLPVISGIYEKKGYNLVDMLSGVIKNEQIAIQKSIPQGCYITARDSFFYDDTDIREHSDKIDELQNTIKKKYKKKSTRRKELNKQLIVKRGENDVCLDKCQPRIKTKSGCFCESGSESPGGLFSKSWCYVDPKTCPKKEKFLPKTITGRHYDYYDDTKNKYKKCFNGRKYIDCGNI